MIAPQVQLKPAGGIGGGVADFFDRTGTHRRERERDPGLGSRLHSPDLTLAVHEAGEAGGRDPERQGAAVPGDLRREVRLSGAVQDSGQQLHGLEGLAAALVRQFQAGRAVHVVERGRGGTTPRNRPECLDIGSLREPSGPAVRIELAELHERLEFGNLGQSSFHGHILS